MVRFSASGVRLDQALAFEANTSRAKAQAWIEAGLVRVGGKVMTKPSYKLRGEAVEVEPPPPVAAAVAAEDIPLEVLYEDPDLIAINKPAGMITHPAPGVYSGTLVNAILGRFGLEVSPGEGEEADRPERVRPGIVHRLDKDTSGVIVVARHEAAHRRLSEAFAGRSVYKRYLALTVGIPPEGLLSAPIGRHPVDRTRMHVGGIAARHAQTDFEVLASVERYALVSAILHTGRTHQIRVHLKHLHAPILGDEVYGRPSELMARQALHAYELRLQHPRTGKYLHFVAPIPADMVRAWGLLGGRWPDGLQTEAMGPIREG
ncbi:MAG: RluA family pseudouridine synthase [Meiothermus sp.]|uniref:RluA family pseudouridine synthase n=1 Tax=Meiothermus sp. TaxID=1955249 RepID=UPI0025D6F69A|nr:RluA family pseudouridine synthase [Meiothermus sp.]MCS7069205.1 RluA family pseudouridine synthase [Meiothermus sp.]MCX7601715.1 RluA family pseudouridine synthase [Meiothermus sp.]MDW8426497.1 RluA family pseudouridine synthase [Meiothermus sp.]